MRWGMLAAAPVLGSTLTASGQSITSVDPLTATRSGRIVIKGAGFGAQPGIVEIGGIQALATRWDDGEVRAYIPESAPLGPVTVRIITTTPSNTASVTVEPRPQPGGRILWKFQADDPYIRTQPAVGPDGTVYFVGAHSHLYALTPEGALRWVRNNTAAFRPPSVGADGTVYVTDALGLVTAVNPDGTTRWSFPAPPNSGTIFIGPNVGPDGNIYGVCQVRNTLGTNFGAFALSPQGQYLWNTPGGYNFRHFPYAWEVASSSGRIYFATGMGFPLEGEWGLHALDAATGQELWREDGLEQVKVAADGNIYTKGAGGNNHIGSYTPAGDLRWLYSYSALGGQPGGDLGVSPDGTCFMTTNIGPRFNAINSDGSLRYALPTWPWKHHYPNVRPDGQVVLVQSIYQSSMGSPSEIRGLDPATGAPLWNVQLDMQGQTPISQVWASEFRPDGAAAYIPTSGNNFLPEPWSYLYAIDTTDSGQPDCYANCDGSTATPLINIADFGCFLNKFAAQDPYANCDNSTTAPTLNIADFACFLNTFAAGCP